MQKTEYEEKIRHLENILHDETISKANNIQDYPDQIDLVKFLQIYIK